MTAIDRAPTATADRHRRASRWPLPLIAGVVAAPMFIALVLLQATATAGFDLALHPLSLLALGDDGWIQRANFLVCGAALIAAALTGRATTRHLTRWTSRMIVAFGAALITAGLLQADPWHGYPAGAVESITWHGALHNVAAAAAGIALVVATITTARAARRLGHSTWARASLATGGGYVVLSIIGNATGDFRVALAAGAAIWCWASIALVTTQTRGTDHT